MNWKKIIIRELITVVATALVFIGILFIIGERDISGKDYYSAIAVIGIIMAMIIAALAAISYEEVLDPFVVTAYVGAIASIITIVDDEYTCAASLILSMIAVGASATSTTTVVVASSKNRFSRKGRAFLILSYLLELVITAGIILIIVFLKDNLNILKLT